MIPIWTIFTPFLALFVRVLLLPDFIIWDIRKQATYKNWAVCFSTNVLVLSSGPKSRGSPLLCLVPLDTQFGTVSNAYIIQHISLINFVFYCCFELHSRYLILKNNNVLRCVKSAKCIVYPDLERVRVCLASSL